MIRSAVYPAILAAVGSVFCAGQGGSEKTAISNHVYVSSSVDLTSGQLEESKRVGERFYRAVAEFMGDTSDRSVDVAMHGSGQRGDGSWATPHVDGSGRIHLYQYGPSFESYFGALPHEMVHALRIDRGRDRDWFLEEGFAEFVALRVGKSREGYPWYGTPLVVAAGQWVANDEALPLSMLRERHRELNRRCMIQSYTLRGSFFDYLGATYGDEIVVEMANRDRAGNVADYERFFGKSFEALESEWLDWLVDAYDRSPDAESLVRRYRSETPVATMNVCRAGVDF